MGSINGKGRQRLGMEERCTEMNGMYNNEENGQFLGGDCHFSLHWGEGDMLKTILQRRRRGKKGEMS